MDKINKRLPASAICTYPNSHTHTHIANVLSSSRFSTQITLHPMALQYTYSHISGWMCKFIRTPSYLPVQRLRHEHRIKSTETNPCECKCPTPLKHTKCDCAVCVVASHFSPVHLHHSHQCDATMQCIFDMLRVGGAEWVSHAIILARVHTCAELHTIVYSWCIWYAKFILSLSKFFIFHCIILLLHILRRTFDTRLGCTVAERLAEVEGKNKSLALGNKCAGTLDGVNKFDVM